MGQNYDFRSPIDRPSGPSAAELYRASLDQQFQIGDRVWYRHQFGGSPIPATVIGMGIKNGQLVYDAALDGSRPRYWLTRDNTPRTCHGYADQFEPLPEADDPAMRCQCEGA